MRICFFCVFVFLLVNNVKNQFGFWDVKMDGLLYFGCLRADTRVELIADS